MRSKLIYVDETSSNKPVRPAGPSSNFSQNSQVRPAGPSSNFSQNAAGVLRTGTSIVPAKSLLQNAVPDLTGARLIAKSIGEASRLVFTGLLVASGFVFIAVCLSKK